eukprot:g53.t1
MSNAADLSKSKEEEEEEEVRIRKWAREHEFETYADMIVKHFVSLENLKYVSPDNETLDKLSKRVGIVAFCEVERFKCVVRKYKRSMDIQPRRNSSNSSATGKRKRETALESKSDGSRDWVQCNACAIWRKLPPSMRPKDLPDEWFCSMNTWDLERSKCYVAQEKIQNGFEVASKLDEADKRNIISIVLAGRSVETVVRPKKTCRKVSNTLQRATNVPRTFLNIARIDLSSMLLPSPPTPRGEGSESAIPTAASLAAQQHRKRQMTNTVSSSSSDIIMPSSFERAVMKRIRHKSTNELVKMVATHRGISLSQMSGTDREAIIREIVDTPALYGRFANGGSRSDVVVSGRIKKLGASTSVTTEGSSILSAATAVESNRRKLGTTVAVPNKFRSSFAGKTNHQRKNARSALIGTNGAYDSYGQPIVDPSLTSRDRTPNNEHDSLETVGSEIVWGDSDAYYVVQSFFPGADDAQLKPIWRAKMRAKRRKDGRQARSSTLTSKDFQLHEIVEGIVRVGSCGYDNENTAVVVSAHERTVFAVDWTKVRPDDSVVSVEAARDIILSQLMCWMRDAMRKEWEQRVRLAAVSHGAKSEEYDRRLQNARDAARSLHTFSVYEHRLSCNACKERRFNKCPYCPKKATSKEYCACGVSSGEAEDGRFMIECNAKLRCGGWIHPACFGLPYNADTPEKDIPTKFVCPMCSCAPKVARQSAFSFFKQDPDERARFSLDPSTKSIDVWRALDPESKAKFETMESQSNQQWLLELDRCKEEIVKMIFRAKNLGRWKTEFNITSSNAQQNLYWTLVTVVADQHWEKLSAGDREYYWHLAMTREGVLDESTRAEPQRPDFDPTALMMVKEGNVRRSSCGVCEACMRRDNCRRCSYCLDMKAYGGPGKMKQKCKFRKCLFMTKKPNQARKSVRRWSDLASDDLFGFVGTRVNIENDDGVEVEADVVQFSVGSRSFVPMWKVRWASATKKKKKKTQASDDVASVSNTEERTLLLTEVMTGASWWYLRRGQFYVTRRDGVSVHHVCRRMGDARVVTSLVRLNKSLYPSLRPSSKLSVGTKIFLPPEFQFRATQTDAVVRSTERNDAANAETVCVCNKLFDPSTENDYEWVQCDACERWHHCACVGLTGTIAESMERWLCPRCVVSRASIEHETKTEPPPPSSINHVEEVIPGKDTVCVCNIVYDPSTEGDYDWIQCDTCKRWHHCACVGLTAEAADAIDRWSCPRCVAFEISSRREPRDEDFLAGGWKIDTRITSSGRKYKLYMTPDGVRIRSRTEAAKVFRGGGREVEVLN